MAPFGTRPGRLQASRSTTHHHDSPTRSRRTHHQLRNCCLTPGRRILDTYRVQAQVQPVDAQRCAHTGADAVGLPPFQLGHKVGIGEVGPGHPHQVHGTGLHSVTGGSQVGDSSGVEDGYVDHPADSGGHR